MSRLSVKSTGQQGLGAFVANLKNEMTTRGIDFASPQHAEAVMSVESLDNAALATLQRHTDKMAADLRDWINSSFGNESFAKADPKAVNVSIEAGVIAAMAAGNPLAYHAMASKPKTPVSTDSIRIIEPTTVGSNGIMAFADRVASIEQFDERELKNHIPYSIAFNINASRQDEFGEAFYRTVVISPDQTGVDVTIPRAMIMNEVRHAITGKVMNFNRRNLVDAFVEPTLLATDTTVNVPVKLSSGADQAENNSHFLAGVAINETLHDGTVVATGPLVPGKEHDILGLGMRTDLATAGVYDNSDALDSRLYLKNLYITLTGQTAAAGPAPQANIFNFDVSRLQRNAWVKSVEGASTETVLTFVSTDIPVSASTTTFDGVAAASSALKFLTVGTYTDVIMYLNVQVNGRANHETGNVTFTGTSITVESAVHYNPTTKVSTPVSDVDLAALRAEFQTTTPGVLSGAVLYSARTNMNRRTRGQQITTLELTERYTIPLLSPITAIAPITSNRDAADLATLITAARIRNSNLAITQLFNYKDTLASYVTSQDRSVPVPEIEGAGRLLVRPYIYTDSFNVYNAIASLNSSNRIADVMAALVNKINAEVYKMYTDSAYQPAADALSGNIGERPLVILGMDPTMARYIMTSGDTRTLSTHFDYKIVVSYDKRMKNQIFASFVRPNQTDVDPLSFGFMAWVPELVGTAPVARNGANIKETMVQPRCRHVNMLPCLVHLDVTNLTQAVAEQLPVRTDEV